MWVFVRIRARVSYRLFFQQCILLLQMILSVMETLSGDAVAAERWLPLCYLPSMTKTLLFNYAIHYCLSIDTQFF